MHVKYCQILIRTAERKRLLHLIMCSSLFWGDFAFFGVLGFLFSLVYTDHFGFFLGCFLTSCDPFYQFFVVNLVGKEERLGGTVLLWGGHGWRREKSR